MLKNVLFLFLLFVFQHAFANGFIVKNDGSKSEIQENSFHVDASEKVIYYQLLNASKEIKTSFKEFNYVIIGVNKFKTFKLDNSKVVSGFFVLAETLDKTLLSISLSEEDADGNVQNVYVFHVIDAHDTIIESHEFNNGKSPKNVHLREEIYSKIKFYFPNCNDLLKRLDTFDSNPNDTLKLGVLRFFNNPVYTSCLE